MGVSMAEQVRSGVGNVKKTSKKKPNKCIAEHTQNYCPEDFCRGTRARPQARARRVGLTVLHPTAVGTRVTWQCEFTRATLLQGTEC